MVKKVVIPIKSKRDVERHAFAGGILFGALVFLISLFSKYFSIFGQITNIITDLYSGIGYEFIIFGIFFDMILVFILFLDLKLDDLKSKVAV